MLERSYKMFHRKSNLPYSDLQRLNVYYNAQRRNLLGALANLERIGSTNPPQRRLCADAAVAINDVLASLEREYRLDRTALQLHLGAKDETLV